MKELMCTDKLATIFNAIMAERALQDSKWGKQNHPIRDESFAQDFYTSIAESAKQTCDAHTREGTLSWLHILNEEIYEAMAEVDYALVRAELVQVAAVVVAMIECIDRKVGH